MTRRFQYRHPLEKCALCFAWLAAAMLLPPWPWSLVVLAGTTVTALVLARVRPAVWSAVLTAPLSFSALAIVPLWWNQGFGAWSAAIYTAPLRSFAASSALLLLGVTTTVDEVLFLLSRARVPASVIDLIFLMYRFLLAAGDEIRAMNRILIVRAPSTTFRRRMDASAQLAASLMTRILARALRSEAGLKARGIDEPIRPLSPRVALSAAGLLVCTLPLPVLLLSRWYLG